MGIWHHSFVLLGQSVLLLFAISTDTAQAMAALDSAPPLVSSAVGNSGLLGFTTAAMLQRENQRSDCAVEGSVINVATGESIARAQVALMGSGTSAETITDSSGQ